MIVYATDSETGRVDAYIVSREAGQFEVGKRNLLMGIRALPTFQVNFPDVTLSSEARLGGDQGIDYGQLLSRSRIALGALAVGVARASFEYARNYARERVQFGVPIATKQAVAFKLADMAIEVDAARLLVWEAAWNADSNLDLIATATQLKQHISRMSLFVTDNGVQVLGGHGYIREHPVERWLRNARGFATFEGLALV
jgi:alkylation response protein AidB-like acyl-CoA dehydrogenase